MTIKPTPLHPASYPKRLLILVAGLTPQIVTESLYALARQDEPFVPTHIHLITTQAGAERAAMLLLKSPPAYFHQLCAELDLPAIEFTERNIHVLRDKDGAALIDIRSPQDNAYVADQIMHLMREWCSQEDSALHVSLAGGRKTMGYYLGTALSLFGRPQDRLSHVLVDEAFENHRDFFYPTKGRQVIYDRNNQPLDTSQARVSLAHIPFVRLSSDKPDLLRQGGQSFSAMVEAAQQSLGPLKLVLNPNLGELRVQGQKARLTDTDMAFMLWFIAMGCDSKQPWRPPGEGEFCQESAVQFLHQYVAMQKLHGGSDERPNESLRKGMDLDWFRNRVKHLKQVLRRELGASMADRVGVVLHKRNPARYGLALEMEQIELEDFEL